MNLLIFFGLGVLLAFTPCVLPMVPIISSIISGQKQLSTARAFKLSLTYVLAMALTYTALGMLVALLGQSVQASLQQPWMIITISILFVLMAFYMLDFFTLRLPSGLQQLFDRANQRQSGGGYLSVALMGILATLVVSPCVTAPLVSILSYIGQTGNVLYGGLSLFMLALGMGLPLLLVGVGQGHWLPRTGSWMMTIKEIMAMMMLAMAIWMLSRILPGSVILLLSGLLIAFSAIFFGALQWDVSDTPGRFKQAGLAVVLIYGVVLMIGGARGQSQWLTPLQAQTVMTAAKAKPLFKMVDSVAALQQALQRAKQEHKGVMLDFHANWCPDCRLFQRSVLSRHDVRTAMDTTVNLRVDMTKSTEQKEAILAKYNVVGVPTILFFDHNGKLQEQKALSGDIRAPLLIKTLKAL